MSVSLGRLFILFSCVWLFSSHASAEVIASLGTELSFEQSVDGHNFDIQHPLSLRGGYEFHYVDLYLEYTRFTSNTHTSVIDISREHTEWLLWTRYEFQPIYFVIPYLALGGGVQYDVIKTNFGSESARDVGTPTAEVAAASGLRFLVWDFFSIELEGRAAFTAASGTGGGNSPNPLFAAGLNLAFRF